MANSDEHFKPPHSGAVELSPKLYFVSTKHQKRYVR